MGFWKSIGKLGSEKFHKTHAKYGFGIACLGTAVIAAAFIAASIATSGGLPAAAAVIMAVSPYILTIPGTVAALGATYCGVNLVGLAAAKAYNSYKEEAAVQREEAAIQRKQAHIEAQREQAAIQREQARIQAQRDQAAFQREQARIEAQREQAAIQRDFAYETSVATSIEGSEYSPEVVSQYEQNPFQESSSFFGDQVEATERPIRPEARAYRVPRATVRPIQSGDRVYKAPRATVRPIQSGDRVYRAPRATDRPIQSGDSVYRAPRATDRPIQSGVRVYKAPGTIVRRR